MQQTSGLVCSGPCEGIDCHVCDGRPERKPGDPASQSWLVIEGDVLTLTMAGLASGDRSSEIIRSRRCIAEVGSIAGSHLGTELLNTPMARRRLAKSGLARRARRDALESFTRLWDQGSALPR